MEYIQGIISLSEYILESKERRHIMGGMLLSVSALFCGLAITAMTMNLSNYDERKDIDDERYIV